MTTHVLQFVGLTDRERKKARPLNKLGKGDHVEVKVRRQSGEDQIVKLPSTAAALLEIALGHLLQGERVAVLAEDQELSPNDAADILGISRPLVVHRMDMGGLPFRYIGKHRRTKLKDVLALKAKIDAQRSVTVSLAEDAVSDVVALKQLKDRRGSFAKTRAADPEEHQPARPAKKSDSRRRPANRTSKPQNIDQLVLGTTNAPYRRTMNAANLVARLTSRDWQNWIAHVATFFTEVRPELVLEFARLHAIPIQDLAASYRSMKSATGESNPALESALERLA